MAGNAIAASSWLVNIQHADRRIAEPPQHGGAMHHQRNFVPQLLGDHTSRDGFEFAIRGEQHGFAISCDQSGRGEKKTHG
jgi:hypothetical protein